MYTGRTRYHMEDGIPACTEGVPAGLHGGRYLVILEDQHVHAVQPDHEDGQHRNHDGLA